MIKVIAAKFPFIMDFNLNFAKSLSMYVFLRLRIIINVEAEGQDRQSCFNDIDPCSIRFPSLRFHNLLSLIKEIFEFKVIIFAQYCQINGQFIFLHLYL